MEPKSIKEVPQSLTVVVMAYNEEACLLQTTTKILGVLKDLKLEYQVLIVNDGSSDATGIIADQLATDFKGIEVIHHSINLGVGEVYWTGFAQSKGQFITFFPADGQFPATIISEFLPFTKEHDMVLGYISGASRPIIGRIFSACERALYSILFGKIPKFQGIMMFRRDLLSSIKLLAPRNCRGWAVVMELIFRTQKEGFRITSRKTQCLPRANGHSHVNNLKSAMANFNQACRLWLLMRNTKKLKKL